MQKHCYFVLLFLFYFTKPAFGIECNTSESITEGRVSEAIFKGLNRHEHYERPIVDPSKAIPITVSLYVTSLIDVVGCIFCYFFIEFARTVVAPLFFSLQCWITFGIVSILVPMKLTRNKGRK